MNNKDWKAIANNISDALDYFYFDNPKLSDSDILFRDFLEFLHSKAVLSSLES